MSERYFIELEEEARKAFVKDRLAFLQEARTLMRQLGYQDVVNLKVINGFGRIDASSIIGLDDVAMSMQLKYPDILGGDASSAEQRLFDLLVAGNPQQVKSAKMVEAGHKAHETRRRKRVRHG